MDCWAVLTQGLLFSDHEMMAGARTHLKAPLGWAGCPRRLAHMAGSQFWLSSGSAAGAFNQCLHVGSLYGLG